MEAIFSRLANTTALFADAAAGGPAAPEAPGDASLMLLQFFPFIAIALLFYLMFLRPQRREQSRRMEMLAGVKKNDRVLTAGGIYGIVTNVQRETDEVTLKVDETTNTKLRVTLSSIARVLGDGPSDDNTNK